MNLMLLLKVFMMVLDIGLRLDPKFNFGTEVTPYLSDLPIPIPSPRATSSGRR